VGLAVSRARVPAALLTTSVGLLAVLAAGCVKAKTLGDRPRPGSEDDAVAPAESGPADAANQPDAPGPAADIAAPAHEGEAFRDGPGEALEADMAGDTPPPPASCSPACGAGSECSEGVCVCSPPACDEGPFFDGGGFHLAAGSDFLVFEGGPSGIVKLNLATRQATPLFGLKDPGTVWGLAVDPHDQIYWCRDHDSAPLDARWMLMRNDTILESRYCRSGLRVTDTHLYVADTVSLFRRRLDGPGVEILFNSPTFESIDVDDSATYYGTNELNTTQLRRTRHDAPGRSEKLFETPGLDVLTIALDRQHVYFAGPTVLRRLPVAGGPAEELWSDKPGRLIRVLALSSTHVYWATSAADICQDTRVFRLGKSGGAAQLLATLPQRCARALVVHGDRVYLATSVSLGADKNAIYRIRQ
jgi:hypothetical protein